MPPGINVKKRMTLTGPRFAPFSYDDFGSTEHRALTIDVFNVKGGLDMAANLVYPPLRGIGALILKELRAQRG